VAVIQLVLAGSSRLLNFKEHGMGRKARKLAPIVFAGGGAWELIDWPEKDALKNRLLSNTNRWSHGTY